jgi:hypothetical protein
LEKSDKFSKIPCLPDILESNFRLTHLYSNIGSFFTSGKNDLVEFILKNSLPLRGVGHSTTIIPLIQTWQGVFQIELYMLLHQQVDFHIPSPNFQEDMQFPKVIIVKPDSVKFFLSLEIDP